jgi:hypothetical protein
LKQVLKVHSALEMYILRYDTQGNRRAHLIKWNSRGDREASALTHRGQELAFGIESIVTSQFDTNTEIPLHRP